MGGRKLKRAANSSRRVDLEDGIEAGVVENIQQVLVQIYQRKRFTILSEPFLRFEQDAEPGAGNILEAGKINSTRLLDAVENSACLVCLRRIEAPGQASFVRPNLANVKYLQKRLLCKKSL